MLISEEKNVTTVTASGINRIELDTRIHLFLMPQETDRIFKALQGFCEDLKLESNEFNQLTLTEELDLADLTILYIKDATWGSDKMKQLRSEPKHFLKPILAVYEQAPDNFTELVDLNLTWPVLQSDFGVKVKELLKVASNVQDLIAVPNSIGDTGLKKLLILRHLYTRESGILIPTRNHLSSVGYSFPTAQILFNVKSGEEVAFLEELEESQLLTSKLIDKVNICPFCEHTQINFREICPHCRSLNISEETTIHHFRCAYIGRDSEFRHGLNLTCPKCSRELRHIGVDYDKPSEVMWCNDCNQNFSEPLLSCYCLACAKTFPPENMPIKRINKYTLSQDGIRAAEEGVLPGSGLINILKKEVGFYKREVFMEMLRIEVFRCRRYKYKSTLSKFNLGSAGEIPTSRKFKNDFAAVINQTFRTTDLFTDSRSGEILVIFTNTDTANAKIAFSRLKTSIDQIAITKIKIDYDLFDLAAQDDSMEGIWEKLN
ncbi:MAG: hypothetical protein E2O76_09750 [Caldithrix sp.]|nr:MAG: hypothetical protein E2O76_09750 [Caldithrix sp.]